MLAPGESNLSLAEWASYWFETMFHLNTKTVEEVGADNKDGILNRDEVKKRRMGLEERTWFANIQG